MLFVLSLFLGNCSNKFRQTWNLKLSMQGKIKSEKKWFFEDQKDYLSTLKYNTYIETIVFL